MKAISNISIKSLCVIIVLSFFYISCEKADDLEDVILADTTAVINSEINFTIAGNLIADGTTFNVIEVNVSGVNNPQTKVVEFTLSEGSFSNNMDSIEKQLSANSNLFLLVKSAKAGNALITAKVDGQIVYEQLNFTSFIPTISNDGITLFVSDTVQVANDESYIEVILNVPDTLANDTHQVNFTSTIGEFLNGSASIKVPLDMNGQARTFLTSQQKGIGELKAQIVNVRLNQFIRFTEEVSSDTIDQYTITNSTAIADDSTYTKITAQAVGTTFNPNTSFTFTTDLGEFSNGLQQYTEVVGANGKIEVFMKSAKAGLASISFSSSQGLNDQLVIQFDEALPEFITVSLDSLILAPLGSVNVTATLERNGGKVSSDYQVIFEQESDSMRNVGSFTNDNVMSLNGTASTSFQIQDSSFLGEIKLKAKVKTTNGDVIGQNTVLVKN